MQLALVLVEAASSSRPSRPRRMAVLAPSLIAAAALAAVAMPAAASAATCTTTVNTAAAVTSAVNSAAAGSTVCVADGSYGRLSLSATKAKPGVTVQAQNPGAATITGASMGGSNITLAQFKISPGSVDIQPSSTGMTVDHNLIIGNRSDYAVYVCPGTTTLRCNDVAIINNKIRAVQRGPIRPTGTTTPTGTATAWSRATSSTNIECGNHNDCFQTVWMGDHLTFRKNYLHDNRGQGFFVKDQSTPIDGLTFEDNLLVRQNLPCDPVSLCPTWQLGAVQIFGLLKNVSIRHNTIWPGSGGGTQWLRGSGWGGPTANSANVFSNMNSYASGLTTGYTASNDTYCGGNGMPTTGPRPLTAPRRSSTPPATTTVRPTAAASPGALPTSSTARAAPPSPPRRPTRRLRTPRSPPAWAPPPRRARRSRSPRTSRARSGATWTAAPTRPAPAPRPIAA